MDYSNESRNTCPIGFEVSSPKISRDDRIEVELRFFFKTKDRDSEKRSFDSYDDVVTVLLDREDIADYLPKTSGSKSSDYDDAYGDRCAFIRDNISLVSRKRDHYMSLFMRELAKTYASSEPGPKKVQCQETVNLMVKEKESYQTMKEFVRYDTLLTLVRKPAVFHSEEMKSLFA